MDFPWLSNYPKNINWHEQITAKPIHSLLFESAKKYPQNPAIDLFGKIISYAELQKQVEFAAKALLELGLQKGTKVGLYMPNCPQFVISYYAVLAAGGVVVNCSPLYSESELEHLISNSDAEFAITLNLKLLYPKLANLLRKNSQLKKVIVGSLPEYLPFPKNILFNFAKAKELVKISPTEKIISWQQFLKIGRASSQKLPSDISPSDTAIIQYTGGTTGVPKGAELTHASVYTNAIQCTKWCQVSPEGQGSVLCVLPLFHVFAMTTAMNFGIASAAKIILHPRFDIKWVLKDLHHKKPACMPGVPTMYNAICNYKDISKYNLRGLKACISGGGPLPVEVKQKFEALTGCNLVEGYGLTEASPVISCNPIGGLNKAGSIGVPFPQTEVLIADMQNKGAFLPANMKGELCVRAPQVMKGYYNNPSETENVIVDGILHTGDVAYIDDEGYIFIVDRIKEMIISGGFKIFPRNVEEIIYKNEKVLECAVIGIPDEYSGQKVKAHIVIKEGETCTADEMLAYLKQNVAKHEVPKIIEFRESLPKSPIGKILKKELK